jgi:hypothetical protein
MSKSLAKARDDELRFEQEAAQRNGAAAAHNTALADPDEDSGEAAVQKKVVDEYPDDESEADDDDADEGDDDTDASGEEGSSDEADDEPGFPEELTDLAHEYDLDPEDYPTPGALERAVRAFEKRVLKLGKAEPEPRAEVEDDEQESETVEEVVADFEAKLDTSGDEWDEKLVESINGALAKLKTYADSRVAAERKKFEAEKTRVDKLIERAQAQEDQQFTDWLDTQFAKLDPAYEPVFGKGNFPVIATKKKFLDSRSEVVATMDGLKRGFEKAGVPVPDDDTLFARAVKSLHDDISTKLARKPAQDKVGKLRKQGLARPSGRKGKPLTGVDKARQRVRQFYAEHDSELNDTDGAF